MNNWHNLDGLMDDLEYYHDKELKEKEVKDESNSKDHKD